MRREGNWEEGFWRVLGGVWEKKWNETGFYSQKGIKKEGERQDGRIQRASDCKYNGYENGMPAG